MRIKKVKISKHSNSFCFIVPKAYIKDGNVLLGQEYDIELIPSFQELVEQKTLEIVQQMTKNANKAH